MDEYTALRWESSWKKVVSMIGQILLTERKAQLIEVITKGWKSCRPHTAAFLLRILPAHIKRDIETSGVLGVSSELESTYGGYPDVAFLGYSLANEPSDSKLASLFLEGCERLRKRDTYSTRPFFLDDLAVLGVADGLATLPQETQMKSWLLEGIERNSHQSLWSSRMRHLASDLLDKRGRLKVALSLNQTDELALELLLAGVWIAAFSDTERLSSDQMQLLLRQLLSDSLPTEDDIERAGVWLVALDRIVTLAAQALIPNVSDTARLLRNVEHSFKRWKWEDKPRQGAAFVAQWLIDNEYDVQSLLWAILYPVYGSDLVDESYLPNWGQTQPRADLGISSLKVIIEVKFIREPKDFNEIEGQIGNDLGLYFKDTNLYDRMIVFAYDDCDSHQPQKYDGLRNALLKRERVEDVIIIRRPGMIPVRSARRSRTSKTKTN